MVLDVVMLNGVALGCAACTPPQVGAGECCRISPRPLQAREIPRERQCRQQPRIHAGLALAVSAGVLRARAAGPPKRAATARQALGARISQPVTALEAGGTFSGLAPAPMHANGSRIVTICGRDGVGKSKVCAALLDLGEVREASRKQAPAVSTSFADKARLLEHEPAEAQRNFSCYNHIYSQRAVEAGLPQRLHLIDTPGHVDRMPLVEHALRVAHGAVIVCSVRSGVNAECGRVFGAVRRFDKPSVLFLNGIDQADDADAFDRAVDALENRLGIRPVVLFAPVYVSGFQSGSHLLNVLDNTMCSAMDCSLVDGGPEGKAAGGIAAWAKRLRDDQIKSLAMVDDAMQEAFVEFEGEVPRMLIESALWRATAAGRIMPLVAGSAKSGLGIDALQEVVHTFIPATNCSLLLQELGVMPLGDIDFTARSPFLGWVFGWRRWDEGPLLQVRVLDGAVRPGQRLRAVWSGGRSGVFVLRQLLAYGHRGELVPCRAGGPGDLVLVRAPKWLAQQRPAGVVLSAAERPFAPGRSAEPPRARTGQSTFALLVDGLEPRERERLLLALQSVQQDDEGLGLEVDTCTGEHRLSCMGAFHLDLLRERLAEEFQVPELPLGRPRVVYRATVKGERSVARSWRRPTPASAPLPEPSWLSWAEVEVGPGARGAGVEVEASSSIAPDAREALECGVHRGLEAAGPGGVQVTDVRVRLLRAHLQREEAAEAVVDAAASAVAEAVGSAPQVTLLEPVVKLEVDVPVWAVGGVAEDLRKRRGKVCELCLSEGELQIVEAQVPLRELFDYSSDLRELSAGEGFFSYLLHGYREAEASLAKHIIEHELPIAHAACGDSR